MADQETINNDYHNVFGESQDSKISGKEVEDNEGNENEDNKRGRRLDSTLHPSKVDEDDEDNEDNKNDKDSKDDEDDEESRQKARWKSVEEMRKEIRLGRACRDEMCDALESKLKKRIKESSSMIVKHKGWRKGQMWTLEDLRAGGVPKEQQNFTLGFFVGARRDLEFLGRAGQNPLKFRHEKMWRRELVPSIIAQWAADPAKKRALFHNEVWWREMFEWVYGKEIEREARHEAALSAVERLLAEISFWEELSREWDLS
jgi:hypothetical protein